jgi:NAD(P)-dependent dehydrogenase (short-subunit alcohol dehydrogenase family)
VAGRSALPFTGAYAASKFALEGAADALRVELEPFGLTVSLVEPGVIATPIWETSRQVAERNIERMPPELEEYYGSVLSAMRSRVGRTRGLAPERVAAVVAHALTSRRPRIRYIVGRDARMRIMLETLLPGRIRDWLVAAAVRRL